MARKGDIGDSRSGLAAELSRLAGEIDEEGLKFLIEQANVLIYNQKVEELNTAARNVEKSRRKAQTGKENSTTTGSEERVHVEKGALGRSYVLVIDNERKIMDEEEIFKMVKIAHNTENEAEGAERIFRWLQRNRDDVIVTCGLKPKGNATRAIYTYMRDHFQIRG